METRCKTSQVTNILTSLTLQFSFNNYSFNILPILFLSFKTREGLDFALYRPDLLLIGLIYIWIAVEIYKCFYATIVEETVKSYKIAFGT